MKVASSIRSEEWKQYYIELLTEQRPKFQNVDYELTVSIVFPASPVSNQWKVAYISFIHKRRDKKTCQNFKGLSIIASTGRLHGRALRGRIEKHIKDMDEQRDFRPGKSYTANEFCIKQLIGKTVHLVFVDIKKAYDSVPTNRLRYAMEKNGINHKYINAARNLYRDNISRV